MQYTTLNVLAKVEIVYTFFVENDTGIDKKIIERGLWIATHRLALQRWVVMGLYGVIALGFGIFFVQFGSYVYRFNDWDKYAVQSVRSFVDWKVVHEASAPQKFEIDDPALFARASGVYDIAAEVFNPNKEWAGRSVFYQFMSNGEPLGEPAESFILPGQRRFFTLFGYSSEKPINSVTVEIGTIKWQRLEKIPETGWLYQEEPAYSGKKIIVENRIQSVIPARVSWQVQNGSTYNFSRVLWQVGLYTGGRLASIAEYTSGKFPFLDIQTIDMTIPQSLPRVDRVVVYPIVNFFDSTFSYLE